MESDLLELDSVTVQYEGSGKPLRAVNAASVRLRAGEVLGIVGESGSGKSTLAHVMMGFLPHSAQLSAAGVRFKGARIDQMSRGELRKLWGNQIAMVHQNPLATLTPTMTVGEQIAETVRQHKSVSSEEARRLALDALAKVNVPNPVEIYKRYPHELSGGQRQRVSIAIAISLNPAVLILDEPTTALDVTTEAVILDLLKDIRSTYGTAMVYISHNLAVVGSIADRVAVMYAGEIVEVGGAKAIFSSPRHPYTKALMDCLPGQDALKRESRLYTIPGMFPSLREGNEGCIFRNRCARRTSMCERNPTWSEAGADHIVRCFNQIPLGASEVAAKHPATSVTPSVEPSLTAERITKRFGNRSRGRTFVAVNDATLTANRAEIVGLVGESGSGKTTLLRCVAGLTDFNGSSLLLNGKQIDHAISKRDRSTLGQLQMVFQDPASTLNPAITVGENLIRHLRALSEISAEQARQAVAAALQRVNLSARYVDRLPTELSGGEKQRVAIARAFLTQPSLVLCDEPLSALDVSVQSAVIQLLLDLQAESGASYVIVSHDIAIIRYISDRIVVMYLGQIVDEGPAETFTQAPLHPYTEALLAAVPHIDGAKIDAIRLKRHEATNRPEDRGCIFASRCPRVIPGLCSKVDPPWHRIKTRSYRCHHSPSELIASQSR